MIDDVTQRWDKVSMLHVMAVSTDLPMSWPREFTCAVHGPHPAPGE